MKRDDAATDEWPTDGAVFLDEPCDICGDEAIVKAAFVDGKHPRCSFHYESAIESNGF